MNKQEKLEIAKKFYDKLGLVDYLIEIKRDDEINADYIYITNMRGPGGLIIADNGEYLFCPSAHGYNYWKDEFTKGKRNTTNN